MSSTQAKQVYSSSEEYEERVQAAKSDWLEGRFKSVCAAAHAHNVGQHSFTSFCPLNPFLGGSPDTAGSDQSTDK
jgi:hypothetical protein